jgi:hypothetical protein
VLRVQCAGLGQQLAVESRFTQQLQFTGHRELSSSVEAGYVYSVVSCFYVVFSMCTVADTVSAGDAVHLYLWWLDTGLRAEKGAGTW